MRLSDSTTIELPSGLHRCSQVEYNSLEFVRVRNDGRDASLGDTDFGEEYHRGKC